MTDGFDKKGRDLDWIKSVQSACIMQQLEIPFLCTYVQTREMGILNEPNSEIFFYIFSPVYQPVAVNWLVAPLSIEIITHTRFLRRKFNAGVMNQKLLWFGQVALCSVQSGAAAYLQTLNFASAALVTQYVC